MKTAHLKLDSLDDLVVGVEDDDDWYHKAKHVDVENIRYLDRKAGVAGFFPHYTTAEGRVRTGVGTSMSV